MKWISVKDQFPKEDGEVLILLKESNYYEYFVTHFLGSFKTPNETL